MLADLCEIFSSTQTLLCVEEHFALFSLALTWRQIWAIENIDDDSESADEDFHDVGDSFPVTISENIKQDDPMLPLAYNY